MNNLALHLLLKLHVLLRKLPHQRLVSLPHRLDLEQPVNLLQRDSLGLGDEKKGEEEGEERQRSEEEVDAVAHRLEHLLREARDEEVEEPVARGRRAARQRAEVGVEEFLAGSVSRQWVMMFG